MTQATSADRQAATAVETPPRVRPGYRGAPPRITREGARLASFVLVRVTGLLLTVLVLGHFALTHIVHDVADTNAAFIARRWGSALWLIWSTARPALRSRSTTTRPEPSAAADTDAS
jgi:hypothetical protein